MRYSLLNIMLRIWSTLLLLLIIHSFFILEPLRNLMLSYFYDGSWVAIVIPFVGSILYLWYYSGIQFFIEEKTWITNLSKEEVVKQLVIKNGLNVNIILDDKFLISVTKGVNNYKAIITFQEDKILIYGHSHLVKCIQKILITKSNCSS